MTTAGGLLLFVLLAIAGLTTWKLTLKASARASERHWLRAELQQAKLAFAEKTFRTWRPMGLIARVDRAYRLDGELYLVEFKTRMRSIAYSSDVIELSVQRLVIERSTGERVNEIGYVLTQDLLGRHRSVHKVQLLGRADVIAVARRREAILSGRVVPKYTDSEGLCRNCSYRAECKPNERDQRYGARAVIVAGSVRLAGAEDTLTHRNSPGQSRQRDARNRSSRGRESAVTR